MKLLICNYCSKEFTSGKDSTTNNTKFFVEVKPTSIQNLTEVNRKLNLTKECIEQKTGYDYILFGNKEIDSFKRSLGEKLKNEIAKYKNRR